MQLFSYALIVSLGWSSELNRYETHVLFDFPQQVSNIGVNITAFEYLPAFQLKCAAFFVFYNDRAMYLFALFWVFCLFGI